MSDEDPFYYFEPIPNGLAHAIQLGDHQIMLIHRRKNYTGYSETPTKGNSRIMSPKQTGRILKIALSVATIAIYGIVHKTDRALQEKIKERYDEPAKDAETEQTD